MAVMQNSLIFGDVNSADYGIYISGEGVFNAPKRDVEMVAIPGRNGEFALDKGRFENIEVTYPAFNFEPGDYESFSKNLADFRNAICALRGYQRLTDTFHPEEYRMATYIGGLDIKPIKYNTASQFNIVFDCKPQRWLTSGEDAVTMGEWGDTETASGEIATFEGDEATGIKNLIVDIEPIQSGSGTPSPDNVRPISGYDSVVTSVSPTTSSSDATTYTTDLNGTRYGGTLDVVSGVLTVDRGFSELSEDWYWVKSGSYAGSYYASCANINGMKTNTPFMSSHAQSVSRLADYYNGCCYCDNSINFRIMSADSTLQNWKDYIVAQRTNGTPIEICYELATPITVQLTAQQVSALVGTNNVWANSGDVTVEYGQTPNVLVNPTLFDASPLLEVKGNGTIGFNGYEIDVANAELGEIYLAVEKTAIPNPTAYSDFSNTLLNSGDDIYIDGITVYAWTAQAYALSATNSNANFSTTFRKDTSVDYDKYIVATKVKPFTAKLGTVYEANDTVTIQGLQSLSSGTFAATINIVVRVDTYYSPSDRSFCSVTPTVTTTSSGDGACYKDDVTFGTIRGYSTQPIPADPAYIDCEIGEAYAIDGGTVVSLNRIIDLGSDLPKLASGANTITYDNTITELKIHPRWWKV